MSRRSYESSYLSHPTATPTFALLGTVIGLLVGFWIIRSKLEAVAYNRITGSSVTTWEAMWVELRVDAQPLQTRP